MANNFSRSLLQPQKHYNGARWAQGRVLLDSDFNEGTRLLEHERRSFALDLIGPNATVDYGFALGEPLPETGELPEQTARIRKGQTLSTTTVQLRQAGAQFGLTSKEIIATSIRAGSVFVGGDRIALDRPAHIAFQRDYLQMPIEALPAAPTTEGEEFRHLHYVHVWEQHVSSAEDQELHEPMLGDAGRSVRVRRMRQVGVYDGSQPTDVTCELAFQRLLDEQFGDSEGHAFDPTTQRLDSTGRLSLSFTPGPNADTCAPTEPNVPRYRGYGNATLQLMLTDKSHFVWTKDDTKLVRVRVSGLDNPAAGVDVELLDDPETEEQLPLENRVVELIPFGALLEGGDVPGAERDPHALRVAAEIGAFSRVTSAGYDRDAASFSLEGSADFATKMNAMAHQWDESHQDAEFLNPDQLDPTSVVYMYARLWHFAETTADVRIPCATPPELGDSGVLPTFSSVGVTANVYGRAGDYWRATLRADQPTVMVPHDLHGCDGGVPPHGPLRYLAPLGSLWGKLENGEIVATKASDCRPRIRRATDPSCIEVSVGDGVMSQGDFPTIQAAADSLEGKSGKVFVRPGIYEGETILTSAHDGITIEGCGDASVLQGRLDEINDSLSSIKIDGATGVTISGFKIRSFSRHRAIDVNNAENVTLQALKIEAVVYDGEERIAGVEAQPNDLLHVEASFGLNMSHSSFTSCLRTALALRGSRQCTFDNMDFRTTDSFAGATSASYEALVHVHGSQLVRFQDSSLVAHGQTGFFVTSEEQLESEDVEFLDLDARAQMFVEGNYEREARSVVDFDAGSRLSVHRSQLSMDGSVSDYAVVSLRGSELVVRSNRIFVEQGSYAQAESSPVQGHFSWGGIHVRGDASDVELLDNTIIGGLGHGITLGSVDWEYLGTIRREGPGRNQRPFGGEMVVDRNLGTGYVLGEFPVRPVNNLPIRRITIMGNRIEGMRSNGISALSVAGLADFCEIHGALIKGNKIVGNLTHPGQNICVPSSSTNAGLPFPASAVGDTLEIPALVWGGIVLGSVSGGVDIRDNEIRDNGGIRTLRIPVSGIFVLMGDSVRISDNRISRNGIGTDVMSESHGGANGELLDGFRTGIGVMFSGAGALSNRDEVDEVLRGSDHRFSPQNVIHPVSDDSSLRVVGNNVYQAEGRALHIVGTGPMTIDGNFFASSGNHGTEADRYGVGDVVFVQNLGKPWEAPFAVPQSRHDDGAGDYDNLRGVDKFVVDHDPVQGFNVYEGSPVSLIQYHLNEHGHFGHETNNNKFIGTGGQVLFSNNQVTYDFEVKRNPGDAPLGYFTAAIMSLDQATVNGNQFGFRRQFDPALETFTPSAPDEILDEFVGDFLSQVMVVGGTVQATANRCSSGLQTTKLSLLTYADMASSVGMNQLTHEALTLLEEEADSILDIDEPLQVEDLNAVLDPQLPHLAIASEPIDQTPAFVSSQAIDPLKIDTFRVSVQNTFVRLLRDDVVY